MAIADSDQADSDTLFKNSSIALQLAPAQAHGSFRVFEQHMDTAMQARSSLARELRDAVASGALELHYQPQVDLRTKQITSFEALLRWNHPVRGAILPGEFISIAEDAGLMGTIGQWALEQACFEAVRWPEEIGVAVNVSAAQFADGTLPEIVAEALAASGLSASRLELEITETVLLQSNEVTLSSLNTLRGTGVRIAVDDFGVGYSSLSYLTSYPFDKIKIDRSFVSGVGPLKDRRAIVRAVVSLCTSLNLSCTAEGVETEEQLDMLASEQCLEAQGYLFSRPVPSCEIAGVLERARPVANGKMGVAPPLRRSTILFSRSPTRSMT